MIASRLRRFSFGPDFDEHHARVEEAAEARHLGIDRIGNDVADAAPEIGIRHVLLTGELLARLDVP
jgi:hypothetical protein